MNSIVFWGSTGQAIVLEEMLSSKGYNLIGVIDNNPNTVSPFTDIPIFHGKANFETWMLRQTSPIYFAIAIGGDNGLVRMQLANYLEEQGLLPANLIHSTAFTASSINIGKGIQILAQSSVCARAVLGSQVIINTSASVDHECTLGNGVHIGPGAKLAGCVKIGDYSFIGTGAVILPRVQIGKNVIVGAGAVVTKNMPDNIVCVGNPAHIIPSK